MARPATPEQLRLKHRLSVRLNDAENDAWQAMLAASSLSVPDCMRRALVAEAATIKPASRRKIPASAGKSLPSKDAQRALFLLAQTSNNVNQLARQVNAAHLAGKISKHMYVQLLVALEEILRAAKLMVPA